MSEREKARRELAEILSKPFPKKKNDPQPPPEDAQVYRIIPGRQKRKWIAQPVAASAYVPYEPTSQDALLAETREAVAQAAREARLRDPSGLGLYRHETLDELVKRQNGND